MSVKYIIITAAVLITVTICTVWCLHITIQQRKKRNLAKICLHQIQEQVDDQRRIARELHDGLGAALAALTLRQSGTPSHLPAAFCFDEVRRLSAEISINADKLTQTGRELSAGLAERHWFENPAQEEAVMRHQKE